MFNSWALFTDTTRQLNILGHDGHKLSVDGTYVGILKKNHKLGLSHLVEGKNSRSLEAEVYIEVLRNLPYQTLEG